MHHLGVLNANVVQTDWTLESSTCQLNVQRKSRSYSCVLQCAVHEKVLDKVGRVCRFNMWKDLWLCLSFHSKEIGGFIVMVEFTQFVHLMMIPFPWEFVLFCMSCLFWDLHGTKIFSHLLLCKGTSVEKIDLGIKH